MQKRELVRGLGAAAALAAAAPRALAGADARTITDHAGRRVKIPARVERVMTTTIFPFPSVLSVFLGSAKKIVGIHKVSMAAAANGLLGELYPEILSCDTSFMTGTVINIESVMRLRPDVVFVNAGDARTIAALENAGLAAVAISPTKWDYDVLKTYEAWIATLEEVFPGEGKASARAVREYSSDVLERVRKAVSAVPESERARALFVFTYDGQKIVTSGKHFFGQYWCDAAGAKNVAEGVQAKNSNAIVSLEDVYRWNPDVIFITNFTPTTPGDILEGRLQDWSPVRAVREKRVYKMPLGTYRSYTPSADTPLTLLWLAKKVYPQVFRDLNIREEARNYYEKLFGVRMTARQLDALFTPPRDAGRGFPGK